MDVGHCNMWTTCCWPLRPGKKAGKGPKCSSNCWQRWDTECRGKRHKSARRRLRYLGFVLRESTILLDQSRKEVILRLPTPKTQQQVRKFIGITGFCRIWIPRYSQRAQPLFELLTGPEENPVNWTEKQPEVFEELRLAITSAPALGLPDLTKPFTLYVTEKDKTAMGVLTQTLGTWDRPIAYLSERLDNVATGWPGCLRVVAEVALPVREATKLTFGQDLIIKVPHVVNTLLRGDPLQMAVKFPDYSIPGTAM